MKKDLPEEQFLISASGRSYSLNGLLRLLRRLNKINQKCVDDPARGCETTKSTAGDAPTDEQQISGTYPA